MKTAEDWKKELHEFFTSDLTSQEECEEHLIKSINQIQLDAIKHGMTLAANIAGYNNTHVSLDDGLTIKDAILNARDNMKEVV